MSFTAKYGADGSLDADEWGNETAKALRDAGYKIVRFGDLGMIYVGQCNVQSMPHGFGYMYQADGTLHEGNFANGRAHGEGKYLTAGKEICGSWTQNKRVGTFAIVDSKGVKWTEIYGADGKRTSRKKDRIEVPNPEWSKDAVDENGEPVPETIKQLVEPDEPARKCWSCNTPSRERNNHAWACRRHKGRWSEATDYRGTGEAPGVWACCGKESRNEPGCTFEDHNLEGTCPVAK